MKHFLILALGLLFISCGSSKKTVLKPTPSVTDFQNTITEEGLFIDLSFIASDSLEGRDTGSEGLKKAAEFLAQRYSDLGLEAVGDDGTYYQHFNAYWRTSGADSVPTKNVVAFLEGTDPVLKNELIVLSAHYDHVGISTPDSTGDTIYNGADDDGSGTVGLLHTAQALAAAKQAGASIKRSILFLHVSGEERGLLGSRYYSDHPIFPIEQTITNLNVDMIGRRDPENIDNPDYVYIIGGKIISSELQAILEEANEESVNLELSDRYNDLNDPNQFYRRSDHWNFGRLGVPFIFYFNGTHADYHRPSDEVDKIDFEALKKRTQLIFMTTALLANSEDRPTVDNQEFIQRTQQ